MFSLFTLPWALLGLLAVPALIAIYWLRNRFRQVPVSSLIFWMREQENREGGLRIRRLQTPLLFFLELLAIVALVLAAAGPLISSAEDTSPLVVVLDDSYSMQAGGEDSPKRKASAAVAEELRRGRHQSVRFVLAGEHPQVLGAPLLTTAEALPLLEDWHGRAPSANLEDGIGLAAEMGGPRARILVVSDHAPATVPGPGRLQWWAFGTSRPNLALVTATRTLREGQERCLLEVANLSAEPHSTTLLVTLPEEQELHRTLLQLAPEETRRVTLRLPPDTPALEARLDPDALAIDNKVVLLPEAPRPVRVAVRFKDSVLRSLVEKALKATQRAFLTETAPDLVFTAGEADAVPRAWQVQLVVDKEAEAYVGPFVIERSHPLTQGLSLDSVIWGAGKSSQITGLPVILAGNIPLVTDTEDADGRHTLRLHLRQDLSTLQDTPAWPILFWNLLQWRAGQRPGLHRANFRLGESPVLIAPPGVEMVQVTSPDGTARQVQVHDGRAVFRADDVGRYNVKAGEQTYRFTVNALNREESDLRSAASGRWGEWQTPSRAAVELQSLSWVLLLLAGVALTVHLTLTATRRI
jgi:hypothetical protein